MKIFVPAFLSFCLMGGLAVGQRSHPRSLNIIPTPQQTSETETRFALNRATAIVLDDHSTQAQFIAEQINEELKAYDIPPLKVMFSAKLQHLSRNSIFIGSPSSDLGRKLAVERKAQFTAPMNREGYFLTCDRHNVIILADSNRGRFYGVMSLLQMMRHDGSGVAIQGGTIVDFPSVGFRGISDDISRGQISTMDNFKRIIRFLARYKVNAYALYIEDMFASKYFPTIGRGRGALTSEEVKDLDTYARRYYVDLIPIFQTLGHLENILYQPEFMQFAEYPGGRTLNVSDKRIYTLLDTMISEIASSFGSPYFNMGADETRDVGLGASREKVATIGLSRVLAEHYKQVAMIIEKHGKRPMMYADEILRHPEILTMIPRDIILVDWDYDPRFEYETTQTIVNSGFQVVVSPAVRNYAGPYPDYLNSFENIQRFSRAGYQDSTLGVLTSSWNDYGGEEFRELNLYGYAWAAECSWTPASANLASFNDAFFRDFYGCDDDLSFKTVYALLASPPNRYSWYELWRHPMLPFLPSSPRKGHGASVMDRLQSIKSTMPAVLSLLSQCKQLARRNVDHLGYLEYVAHLNLWFADKVSFGEEVRRFRQSAKKDDRSNSTAKSIVASCTEVLNGLKPLRNEFEHLWLQANKPEGLDLLLKRWDRQASYWEEKIAQVQNGVFWVDPEIESQWIYYPVAVVGQRDTVRAQHAWYRKQFNNPGQIRSATLQLIGDSYARLWVNSRFVGEVYARRSNSLSAEYQRIKMFDILPYLNDSTNVVAVESQDFSIGGAAGTNVYCEIQETNGFIDKIITDTTWCVSDSVSVGWQSAMYDDHLWSPPAVKPYPYTIVRPDFPKGRSSWIEQ